jgi:hypothetical protein
MNECASIRSDDTESDDERMTAAATLVLRWAG